jgi:putative pyruvate formate lyase activating enzyme
MWRFTRPDAVTVLADDVARRSLRRYFAVMQDEKPAQFMLAKRLPIAFSEDDSADELWRKHDEALRTFADLREHADSNREDFAAIPAAQKSFLDLKVELASRILRSCHFCARKCGIDRTAGQLGYCRCGSEMMVSSIFEHMGEEPELVPSGTIFTMGCTLRCKHCQNWTISQWMENGEVYEPDRLAEQVERLRLGGCRNANLVGGEPTPWLCRWLETFRHVDVNVPVVWNSNSYYSPETVELLAGFADVYLLDFKYGPDGCAERISEAKDYWKVCTFNHLEAKRYGELIIRVLVLPGHLDCCVKPILNWIAENLGRETRVNVMFQYRPEWQANETPELRRRLSRKEMEEAIAFAEQAKLTSFIT